MHDWFRGVNGTFDKAVSALEKLVDNGVDNEIVTCLTKLNCFEKPLDEIYKLARSLNVDYWRLNRFRANGRGKDSNDFLALSKEDLQRSYSYLADIMHDGVSTPEPIFRSAFGGYYSIEGDPSGNTAFRIQPNGEVSPSVFLKESGGNIKEKSVEEIMNSEIFRKIRNREPKGKCMVCPSYYHCKGGDAGASYLQYGHFNGPDPLCWLRPTDRRTKPKINFSDKWNVHEKYLCTVYVPIK